MKVLTLGKTPIGGSQQFSCSKAITSFYKKTSLFLGVLEFSMIQSCFMWFAQPRWSVHRPFGVNEIELWSCRGFQLADAKGFKRLMAIGVLNGMDRICLYRHRFDMEKRAGKYREVLYHTIHTYIGLYRYTMYNTGILFDTNLNSIIAGLQSLQRARRLGSQQCSHYTEVLL